MNEILIFLIPAALFGVLLGLTDWRAAFLATIFIGFAQDPLRKVVPDQPVWLLGLCFGALILALVGAMSRFGTVSLRPLTMGNERTRAVLVLFIGLVLLQAAFSLYRFGSPIVSGIGMLSYLSPIPGIWLAYHYSRGTADIRRFTTVYVVLAAVVTSGIYLSRMGVQSPFLVEVGDGLVLYDEILGQLQLHSGLMRAPEVAAWHAGAGACLMVVLAVSFRSTAMRLITPAAVLFFVTAGVLTGRRKMLVVAAAFVVIYMLLLYYYRQRTARRALMFVAVLTLVTISSALTLAPEGGALRPYVARGQTVFDDAGDRFTNLGLASVGWAINAGGFFGLGVGAGTQGTQRYAGGTVIAAGASEGGLGKIVVELGVPGLALVLMLTYMIGKNLLKALRMAADADPTLLRLSLGLVAFVTANIPVFIGASQIYGDPFVLIVLGSMVGFAFAVPRVLRIKEQQAALQAQRLADAGRLQLDSAR